MSLPAVTFTFVAPAARAISVPDAVRVRKKVLAINRRERREDAIAEEQAQE